MDVYGLIGVLLAGVGIISGAMYWAGAIHQKLSTACEHLKKILEVLKHHDEKFEHHDKKLNNHERRITDLEGRK